jgi:hypothetical protein
MAIPNWLPIAISIANTIATLIGPLLVLFVASRMNQSKPTPEVKQPKKRTQIIGGWLRRAFSSIWVVPLFGIVISIFVLRSEFRRATPVTGWVIFEISFTTASIFYNLALIFIISITRQILSIANISHKLSDTDSGILEISRDLHNRVKKLEEKPKTKKLPKG